MSYHECYSSSSDSDTGMEEEALEALRRACSVTGVDQSSSVDVDYDDTYESEDEDLEKLRSIQKRFSVPDNDDGIEHNPISMKPLRTILPSYLTDENDDYNDAFETLCAIQRRISQYDAIMNMDKEISVQRSEQVGATNNIDLRKESSPNSLVKRVNNGQGFADCVDGRGSDQNLDISSNITPDTPCANVSEGHEPGSELVPVTDSFPKSAQAFFDAIKKNRMCQKLIHDKLGFIDARMEEIRKLIERVKMMKDFQTACRTRTGRALSQKKDPRIQLISIPKQRANASKIKDKNTHAIYQGPAENSHVAHYRHAMSKYPFSLSREPWSKEDKENLLKGTIQQFQKEIFTNNCRDATVIENIQHLKPTSKDIKSFSKFMWDRVASEHLTGRSGPECESRWRNCEDSSINHGPWSATEDNTLLFLVLNRGINNWFEIAKELKTNRTPFQCLSRYQRSLNGSMIKNEWTQPDDEELRKAVAEYGDTNWQLVASTLEGRTGTQCSNRWKKSLNPLRERVGKWDADEDKRLKIAVRLFGAKNWNKIAKFVPGRTQVQCRERWVNCLDPCLNMNEWTEDEDMKLKEAIEEHGYCWSKIAASIPPRTDSQCLRRWKVLYPDQVSGRQADRKLRRSKLMSNFVDREGERPDPVKIFLNPPLLTESGPKASEDDNKTKKRKRSMRARKVTCAENVSVSTNEKDVSENNDHVDITINDVAFDGEADKKALGKLRMNQRVVPEIRSRRARRVTHTEKVLRLVDEEDNDGHADITTGFLVEESRRIDDCEIEKKATRKRKWNQREKEVEEVTGCISKKPKNSIKEHRSRDCGLASADDRGNNFTQICSSEKGDAELKVYVRRRNRQHNNNENSFIKFQRCSSSIGMNRKTSEDELQDEETFGSFLIKYKKKKRDRMMLENKLCT